VKEWPTCVILEYTCLAIFTSNLCTEALLATYEQSCLWANPAPDDRILSVIGATVEVELTKAIAKRSKLHQSRKDEELKKLELAYNLLTHNVEKPTCASCGSRTTQPVLYISDEAAPNMLCPVYAARIE
jgi:hypothetical protein